jgi:murein L,D-transpeptidase YcbB/YkuD
MKTKRSGVSAVFIRSLINDNAAKKLLLFLVAICILVRADEVSTTVPGSPIADRIDSRPIKCTPELSCASPYLSTFYQNRQYAFAWVKNGELNSSGEAVSRAIRRAYVDGFDPRAYHVSQINKMVNRLNNGDTSAALDLELTLTDGLFLYLNNLVYGLQNGRALYPTWPIADKSVDIQEAASKIARTGDVDEILVSVAPKYPGYAKLRDRLSDYYRIASQGGWSYIPGGETLKKGSRGKRVVLLQRRLYLSGELSDNDTSGEFDKDLQKAVIKYQQNNGLNDDGVVNKQTLNSLNVPIEKRIRQIGVNMDRMRFLFDDYPSRYVRVNIPSYTLEAFEDGKLDVFSGVVVGKPNKRTCVLNSQIARAEINPYWNIPPSIVREILPDIQADPNYLADNGIKIFQVGSDSQYSRVDPSSINWADPNIANLRFREDPGEDNALGRFKFIFDNKCGIYLHDSIAQSAFDETRRGLSHGCIRIAEVDEFANYLLKPNGWDSKRVSSEVDSKKHQFVKLSQPTQLYVVYLTSWYDVDEGSLQFRDDIYHYDKLSAYPYYLSE